MQPYSNHRPVRIKVRRIALAQLSQNKGFSLIELLVTLTIAGILVGTAVPDFSKLIAGNRVNAVANELFTSLSAARSYAINQHALVHVCAMSLKNPMKCSENRDYNSNWSNGWLIFSDLNANNELDKQDTVLKAFQTSAKTNIIFNQRGRLRFFPDGSARSAGFYLCDSTKTNYKHILLLHTGRARSKTNLSQRQRAICSSA